MLLLTIHNRALLRGIVAGAVALGGLSACSRSDRSEAARDTSAGDTTQTGAAVMPADTQASGTTQPGTDTSAATSTPSQPAAESKDSATAGGRDVSGYHAMGHETDTSATATAGDTTAPEMAGASAETAGTPTELAAGDQADTVTVVGDSSSVDKPGPRAKADTVSQKADSIAKYHEAERIRPPEDSSETRGQVTSDSSEMAAADTAAEAGAPTDTTAAGYEPMARDTSTVLAQGDTSTSVQVDTTAQAETDTTALQVQPDTTTEAQTELAVEDQPDTVTVVGDSSSVDKPGPRAKEDTLAQKADSLARYHEADRARPPEDSTETLGQVTTDQPNYDVEAVGDANPDVAGAAPVPATGNIVTGAEAVALMTREGKSCRVEDSREVQWDLAGSPATMNPCGTGTMTLPKVQTGEER
jgi:hypothetical protein